MGRTPPPALPWAIQRPCPDPSRTCKPERDGSTNSTRLREAACQEPRSPASSARPNGMVVGWWLSSEPAKKALPVATATAQQEHKQVGPMPGD